MVRKVDTIPRGRAAIAASLSRALLRLRRWWGYRPERRYMRGPGRVAP